MVRDVRNIARGLAARFAVLRARDFERHGVSRHWLKTLVGEGQWERTGRGLYHSTRRSPGPNHSLLEVTRQSPQAVICLLSALRFHELTTETPSEVWIALPRNAWTPHASSVRMKVVHLTGASFTAGIEEHRIEGDTIRIYSVAKTVADCFKFRNQIGTQIAVEALRDAWRSRKMTIDDLWQHAKICRVANVIRPYLEVVTQ